jgi:glycyl-tRNA synthetase alpha chain
MKPSPAKSRISTWKPGQAGYRPDKHDIRFVEDNWESPTLGAWGWLGSVAGRHGDHAVHLLPAVGSIDVKPVSVEITYGLERLAMYIQGKENVFDVERVEGITYGDVFHRNEVEQSTYNFELSDAAMLFSLFDTYEKEAIRIVDLGYVLPAYDYVLKCSHTFNLLDARGAISVSERTAFIGRVRTLARLCAQGYLEQREKLGYPLLKGGK